ncbi:PPE family protein [Candidatus Mycobacterium wuenschmannii]|uniref:PPE family protein n=1 Tax=Candidatus Mycobacterium wuenschmannii TaxID=3027808 RepID=A0ABY8VXC4_9MYCO|nr:PPE family protein [Candidatus Mycobacterium wuenschmannii]WIM88280.1 PPE family protein [Candidatus Mycobacterium wuenschmannii]
MDFAAFPPEVNSARMYAGPGAGPMLAAASAWDALAAELQSTSAAYRATITELTGGPWLGASSAEMTAATNPFLAWMTTTGAQAEQTAAQARAAAAAYETAFAMTVPPAVIVANRSLLMTLIATNIFGQNTAAIAATEVQYAEMWAQDATAMYGYAGAAATAATLTAFSEPPPTTNPTGGVQQAAAASQSIVSNGARALAAIPQAIGAAAAPAAVDPIQLIPLLTVPITTTAATVGTIGIASSFTSFGTTVRGLLINADRDYDNGKGPFTGNGVGGTMLPQWIINGTGGIGAPSDAVPDSEGPSRLGQASKVGRLSVPSGWTVAAPEIRSAAYSLPITSAAAAPEGGPGAGNLFGNMGLAGAAGGAVGSTASAGRGNERVRINPRPTATPAKAQPTEAVAAIATELQELATRAQSLLSKLAESGLLTTEEVTEQKRRFLG